MTPLKKKHVFLGFPCGRWKSIFCPATVSGPCAHRIQMYFQRFDQRFATKKDTCFLAWLRICGTLFWSRSDEKRVEFKRGNKILNEINPKNFQGTSNARGWTCIVGVYRSGFLGQLEFVDCKYYNYIVFSFRWWRFVDYHHQTAKEIEEQACVVIVFDPSRDSPPSTG